MRLFELYMLLSILLFTVFSSETEAALTAGRSSGSSRGSSGSSRGSSGLSRGSSSRRNTRTVNNVVKYIGRKKRRNKNGTLEDIECYVDENDPDCVESNASKNLPAFFFAVAGLPVAILYL